MFSLKKKPTPHQQRQYRISEEYTELTERLSQIRTNFDHAIEPDAIDALIFEENSTLARLSLLYKEAKASGITLEAYEQKNS